MVSSGLLRRVALVRTDVSEEPGASFTRVTKIGELGKTQAATSNRPTLRSVLPTYAARSVRRLLVAVCVVPSSPIFVTLMKEAPVSYETSVLTRATRRNNPEDTILYSHRRENLKTYILIFCLVTYVVPISVAADHGRSASCSSMKHDRQNNELKIAEHTKPH
jgi:hypothetical protein